MVLKLLNVPIIGGVLIVVLDSIGINNIIQMNGMYMLIKPNKIIAVVKKCSVSNYPTWCGYLQPSEILLLIDIGCKIDKFHQIYIDRAKKAKAEGKSNPSWFYFYPNKTFLKYTNKKDQ
jgi:2-keto-3-deoxy-6-phosphogluconate aldolase